MRLTSRSNSARSKKCLADHGRMPFSRVAITVFNEGVSMLLFPWKVIEDTCTVPFSLHAQAHTTSSRSAALRSMTRLLVDGRFLCFLAALTGCGAARFQALPQPFHQIHHLAGGGRFRGGEAGLLAFHPRLDQLHQILAVLVSVLGRVPLGGGVVDGHLRHVPVGR